MYLPEFPVQVRPQIVVEMEGVPIRGGAQLQHDTPLARGVDRTRRNQEEISLCGGKHVHVLPVVKGNPLLLGPFDGALELVDVDPLLDAQMDVRAGLGRHDVVTLVLVERFPEGLPDIGRIRMDLDRHVRALPAIVVIDANRPHAPEPPIQTRAQDLVDLLVEDDRERHFDKGAAHGDPDAHLIGHQFVGPRAIHHLLRQIPDLLQPLPTPDAFIMEGLELKGPFDQVGDHLVQRLSVDELGPPGQIAVDIAVHAPEKGLSFLVQKGEVYIVEPLPRQVLGPLAGPPFFSCAERNQKAP